MSHWVKACSVVPMVGDKHADKTSIQGSSNIILSKRIKIRREIKMVKDNDAFVKACEKAGVKPTRRQFGKWNRNTGIAYKMRKAS